MENKLLILADSPTIPTGFSRVIRNLTPGFIENFQAPIIQFAIGYRGAPYIEFLKHWLNWEGLASEMPLKLFPAGSIEEPVWWNNLAEFLNLIRNTKPTHVFMMHDPWVLNRIAGDVRKLQDEMGVQFIYYIPVDGTMRPEWAQICSVVSHPVAYTEFGKAEIVNAQRRLFDDAETGNSSARSLEKRIKVIPHGTDTDVYYPVEKSVREDFRNNRFLRGDGSPILNESSFLITNVNSNQKRKDIVSTLAVFRQLVEMSENPKDLFLYLHMNPTNPGEGIELEVIAGQLGLHDDVLMANPALMGVPEEQLNLLYNASDLVLTTTLGEGWGLTITEAMSCGIPVAAPNHTSIPELFGDADLNCGIYLPATEIAVCLEDNSTVRCAVNVDESAQIIHDAMSDREALKQIGRNGHERMLADRYNWDTIAGQWCEIMF